MDANTKPKNESRTQTLRNEEKWTKPLMDAGWTVIPSVIIQRQSALGLEPIDLTVLLHLASRWWTADNCPHPSLKTLAQSIGVSVSTVQRSLTRMKDAGFLKIRHRRRSEDGGQTSSSYHFDGLIEKVTPYAEEELARRAKHQEEEQQRSLRKRPRSPLRIVEPK